MLPAGGDGWKPTDLKQVIAMAKAKNAFKKKANSNTDDGESRYAKIKIVKYFKTTPGRYSCKISIKSTYAKIKDYNRNIGATGHLTRMYAFFPSIHNFKSVFIV